MAQVMCCGCVAGGLGDVEWMCCRWPRVMCSGCVAGGPGDV